MTISSYIKIGLGLFALLIMAYVIHNVFNYGRDTALEGVRKNNERLGTEADKAALDYDDCMRANRMWDWRNNRCGGNAPNGGN
jgi:hypothetical protein